MCVDRSVNQGCARPGCSAPATSYRITSMSASVRFISMSVAYNGMLSSLGLLDGTCRSESNTGIII